MNDHVIITVYVITEDIMQALGHSSYPQARVSDAEIMTMAVCAALYFRNHQERAVQVMTGMKYVSKPISISRVNRRIHQLKGWLELVLAELGALFSQGESFVLDSLPLPQSAWTGLWWVLCRQAREVLWVALTSAVYAGGLARRLRDALGSFP